MRIIQIYIASLRRILAIVQSRVCRLVGTAMSGDNAEGTVGIEMDELQDEEDPTDVDYKPTEKEKKASGPSYEERFDSLLTEYYDDKKTWWDAVEDLLKKDGEFAEKVSCS